MNPLAALHAAALASDEARDWRAFYQALAGTTLVVGLTPAGGLAVDEAEGTPMARAFTELEGYAATLANPAPHAELPGQELARLLADNAIPLEMVTPDGPVLLAPEQLRWTADTYGAEVAQDTAQGVRLTAPEPPSAEVMEVLGQSVAALGKACAEAWLVELAETGRDPELVLVLSLAADAREMEGRLAETVTRAVQAVTDRPFAVACPDPGTPLLAQARAAGIGLATG